MPAALRRGKGASLLGLMYAKGNDFRPSRGRILEACSRASVKAKAVRRLDAAFKAIQSKGR